MVRAVCVRCPWLLAKKKVATIFGIFPFLLFFFSFFHKYSGPPRAPKGGVHIFWNFWNFLKVWKGVLSSRGRWLKTILQTRAPENFHSCKRGAERRVPHAETWERGPLSTRAEIGLSGVRVLPVAAATKEGGHYFWYFSFSSSILFFYRRY